MRLILGSGGKVQDEAWWGKHEEGQRNTSDKRIKRNGAVQKGEQGERRADRRGFLI